MRLRRKSKKRRAVGAVGTYLKFKAISKAAKSVRKGLESYAAYKAAKRAPKAVKEPPVRWRRASAAARRSRRPSDAQPRRCGHSRRSTRSAFSGAIGFASSP
jgi:hypothetical protein